jgi:biopolymer transport protein ExbD
MLRWVGLGVVVACCGCISPVMSFGSGKSAKQAQRETLNDFTAARVVVEATWVGEITKRRIRVWADNQYRTQNVHWQKAFEEPLEFANRVLTPIFGLELVAEYNAWDRHVPGSTLADDVTALQAHDPGTDVFAVVGLTSALSLVSATFDELGLATIGGRHVMMRGFANIEERKLFAEAFRDLRADEREYALESRRRHKTGIVLLHELAHNLGADHDGEENWIMSAGYSHHATAFSERARWVMMRAIDQRLGRAANQTQAAQPVAAPPPSKPAAPDQPRVHHAPIVVRVTSTGATLVAGKPIDAAALDALLATAFAEDPETEVLIQSDRKVPVGAVSGVIDRAKAAGLTKFSLGN